ncbi:hypothetical protein Agub_g5125 [Astrephomene gubernaculifera]|uniref:Uncharacterized protein n=1 Tax=Astrephomene gubernaculifera TaxID=47775 RepID=A0AAD3DQD4_9CHLO|nr:hypothetical protein Agub_g5125 [Astrephomene gubernaculifera]
MGTGGGSSSGQKGTPTSSGRDTATTRTRNQHPGVRPACMANVVAASQAQSEATSLRTQPSEPSSLRVHRRSPSVDLISSNPIADTDMATCMGAEDLGTARPVPAVTIALAGSMSPRPLPARHGHRRNRSSPSGCTSSLDTATATAVGAAPSTLANIRGYASMRHPLADEEGAEGEVVRPGAPEGGSTQGPAACSRSSSLASESVDPQGQAALSQAPSLTVHELTTIEQAEWEQATGVVVVRTVTAHASGGSSSAATRTDGGCAVSSKAGPQDRALPPVKGRLPAESSGTDFPSFHPPQPQPEPEPRPCHRPSDSFCTDMPTASGSQNHAEGHSSPSHTTSTSAYSRRSQRSHSFSFDVEGLLPAQGRGSPAAMVDRGNNSSSGSVAAAPRLASTAAAAAAMAHGATRGGRSGTEVHAAAASLRSMAAASTGDGRPPLYRLKPSGRQSQRMAHLEAVAGAERNGREDGWLDEGGAEARSSTACSPEAQRRRLLTSEDVVLRVYAMCVTVLMALLAVAWMAPRWQLNGWQM